MNTRGKIPIRKLRCCLPLVARRLSPRVVAFVNFLRPVVLSFQVCNLLSLLAMVQLPVFDYLTTFLDRSEAKALVLVSLTFAPPDPRYRSGSWR